MKEKKLIICMNKNSKIWCVNRDSLPERRTDFQCEKNDNTAPQ